MSKETENSQEPQEPKQDANQPDYQKQLAERESALQQAQAEINRLKDNLLDPSYLDYLEKQSKQKKEPKQSSKTTDTPQTGLTAEDVKRIIEDTLAPVTRNISQVQARQELADIKGRYKDFDNYKDDILKILESSQSDLTYEQAYMLAKAHKMEKEANDPELKKKRDEEAKKLTATERPGGLPLSTVKKGDFKTDADADKATVEALREKYPGLGDQI